MDNTNIDQRVAILETTVDEHTRLLNVQSEKNDVLNRLSVLLEREMVDSKERERRQEIRDDAQNKQLEKFGETLVEVNRNLSLLNNTQKQLSQRVDNIENTLQENNISTSKVFKGILKEIGLGVAAIIIAYLLFKLGIAGGIQH